MKNITASGDDMNLNGKTVLFLGSSVTYGSAANGISFADIMAEECGINCVKEAVSGTTLADINDLSYVSRLKNVDKSISPDLFIGQLSTNDTKEKYNLELSEIEKAISFILTYVKETYSCPIVFYTGTYFENEKYKKMIELLYNLQKEYDFYILDLFNDEKMRSVSAEDYKRYMCDPVHPSYEGYKEWWTPEFIKGIKQI